MIRILNTPEEESARINIPLRTMAKDRCTNRLGIPFLKIGRSVRYSPQAVDIWLSKQARNSVEG